MIRDYEGNKLTAKQAAAIEIDHHVLNGTCCADSVIDQGLMTEKESKEYSKHLQLYCNRISKILKR